jgi:hypothetical protein
MEKYLPEDYYAPTYAVNPIPKITPTTQNVGINSGDLGPVTPYYQGSTGAQNRFYWGERPAQMTNQPQTYNSATKPITGAPQQAYGSQSGGSTWQPFDVAAFTARLLGTQTRTSTEGAAAQYLTPPATTPTSNT